jgi:hypothetical protein
MFHKESQDNDEENYNFLAKHILILENILISETRYDIINKNNSERR